MTMLEQESVAFAEPFPYVLAERIPIGPAAWKGYVFDELTQSPTPDEPKQEGVSEMELARWADDGGPAWDEW
jgi:hypothetical protein